MTRVQTPAPTRNPTPQRQPDSGVARAWRLLFSFEGRVSRLQYWLSQIGILVLMRILALFLRAVAKLIGTTSFATLIMIGLFYLLVLATFLLVWWSRAFPG